MTEREIKFRELINYWMPVRWFVENVSYEWQILAPYGDDTEGGVDLTVSKNNGAPVQVRFTNAECFGDAVVGSDGAKQRIYAAFEE
jgi:hypothetical protein